MIAIVSAGSPAKSLVSILGNLDTKTGGSKPPLKAMEALMQLAQASFHFSEMILPYNYCHVRIKQMVK